MNSIEKQAYVQIPIASGMAWGNDEGDFVYEEKMDGQWYARTVGNSIVAGELMRGGQFYVFDVAMFQGEDVRQLPLRDRLPLLAALQRADLTLLSVARGSGGEFLRAVLARGGEGVVRKRLDGNWWSPLEKCKRSENFTVRVAEFCGGTQSVTVADAASGEARGKVVLRGGKCDRVRVGSVLKLNGFGLTANGRIREPRVDSDAVGSWLVRF